MARKQKPTKKKPAVQRASSSRQRLRLIDACISALHIHGPSRTTVEKVVAIAGMSPGIVRFYFSSKAAMLVATLQYLATEFEQRVLLPVAQLRGEPARALTALVDLYLDADIASPRKVSVWYSFWGEASSRAEYLDICGQKDARFAELVRELVERLLAETDDRDKDADAIALGLIGVLEMLWQDIAFQPESRIDGGAARRRAFAYLRSVFPGRFAEVPGAMLRHAPAVADAWQVLAHESAIPATGSFVTAELASGPVLLRRDERGRVEALRNVCPVRPHALVVGSHGRLAGDLECPIHGALSATPAPLEVAIEQGFVLVRPASAGGPGPSAVTETRRSLFAGIPLPALSVAAPSCVCAVAAPWTRLVEHWRDFDFAQTPVGRLAGLLKNVERTTDEATGHIQWRAELDRGGRSWSARRYATLALASSAAAPHWERWFVPPNQWIERRPDGVSVLQAVPAAGGCTLRWLEYRIADGDRATRALGHLARRLRKTWIEQDIEAVESQRRADH